MSVSTSKEDKRELQIYSKLEGLREMLEVSNRT